MRGAFSKQIEVTSGVLQGSGFRTLSLMICASGLPGLKSYFNMFADDTKS